MAESNSILCDACQEYVLHANRFIHKNSKYHKYKVTQLENYKRKVIITERIVDCIRSDFLQFLEERFGKIRMFHCFSSTKMIITFEAIESAEKCLHSRIIYNSKKITVKKPYNIQHLSPAVAVSHTKDAISISYDCKGSFEDQLCELIAQIEQTSDDCRRLELLVGSLQFILEEMLPGCRIEPFGSVNTGLASNNSDVDLFGYLDYKQILHLTAGYSEDEFHKSIIKHIRKFLYGHKNVFSDIVGIANATVPIVKFTHLPSGLKCDLSFKGGYGVHNSYLLREMIATDSRIRPMLMFLKHWAKTHDIIMVGYFSSYSIVMLAIYYLQTISILPTIESLQKDKSYEMLIDTWNCGFNDEKLKSYKTENRDTIIELLAGFFTMCSEFPFEEYVITPYTGEKYSHTLFENVESFPAVFGNYANRIKFGWDKLPIRNLSCIRDPFVHSRNLTGGINQAKLNYFKEHCKLSAKTINETNTEENLLKTLLEQEVLFPHKECSKHKKAIPIRGNLPNQEKIKFENDKINYLKELKIKIEDILYRSIRCDFNVINESSEEQDGKTTFNFTYNCTVFYNTWEKRKMYNKNKNKDRMTREKIVTDAVIRSVYEDIKPENPLFKCNIIFKLDSDFIEFSNECAEFNTLYDQSYYYINDKLRFIFQF